MKSIFIALILSTSILTKASTADTVHTDSGRLVKNRPYCSKKVEYSADSLAHIAEKFNSSISCLASVLPKRTISIDSMSKLIRMNIFDFCNSLGISTDEIGRMRDIYIPLLQGGKVIKFHNDNDAFKRNILENLHLISCGKVSQEDARKWLIFQ